MNESVDTLNLRLSDLYGRSAEGRPYYRLVFSTSQTEKRRGEFEDYYGKIFLRRFVGVREVPKYSYAKDRWILEVLLPIKNSEIFGSEYFGSYEPLWVFQDKDGNFLQPNWKVIEIIIHWNHNREVKSPADMERDEEAWYAKQEQQEFERLDDEMPTVVSKLASREGITVPKEYKNE